MVKVKKDKLWKKLVVSCILVTGAIALVYWKQCFGVHAIEFGKPAYEKVPLSVKTDYETLFFQTGLGPVTVEGLLKQGKWSTILQTQENFFAPREKHCDSLIGWFTKEDKLQMQSKPQFVDLQPGDILVTLSTHSIGWRHGHAALVLDENITVESMMWGMDSACGRVENWLDYANWAVLRVKEVTPDLQQQVADYAESELCGVPYHLSAGFIGAKAPETDAPYFGVHCAYLVWYVWNHFGYDLDSDGGRLVTASDLLHSDLLEVVQLYGMDPREFIE